MTQISKCLRVPLEICLLWIFTALPPFLCSFRYLLPSLFHFLLHAFYLHSPIWQAPSSARVTLASQLPQKVRKGTEKNPATFRLFSSFVCFSVSAPSTNTHTQIYSIIYLWWCTWTWMCSAYWRAIAYVYVRYFYANRTSSFCVCPLAESMLVWAHTDRWGTERLFAEEFAL